MLALSVSAGGESESFGFDTRTDLTVWNQLIKTTNQMEIPGTEAESGLYRSLRGICLWRCDYEYELDEQTASDLLTKISIELMRLHRIDYQK